MTPGEGYHIARHDQTPELRDAGTLRRLHERPPMNLVNPARKTERALTRAVRVVARSSNGLQPLRIEARLYAMAVGFSFSGPAPTRHVFQQPAAQLFGLRQESIRSTARNTSWRTGPQTRINDRQAGQGLPSRVRLSFASIVKMGHAAGVRLGHIRCMSEPEFFLLPAGLTGRSVSGKGSNPA